MNERFMRSTAALYISLVARSELPSVQIWFAQEMMRSVKNAKVLEVDYLRRFRRFLSIK